MDTSPIDIARALHAALEAGKHGDELRPFFTPDATTLEHPNRIKPGGASVDLERMLAAASAGAGLLSKQTYRVRSAIAHGSSAILRLVWSGVIANDAGPFHAGQVLTAHIAQFIETRDGRVAAIETFDCYEPFA